MDLERHTVAESNKEWIGTIQETTELKIELGGIWAGEKKAKEDM